MSRSLSLSPLVHQSMRSRSLVGFAVVLAVSTACGGLKDALTAHVDVVARAGSQELSVTRLSDLLGNAKIQVPVTRDNAGDHRRDLEWISATGGRGREGRFAQRQEGDRSGDRADRERAEASAFHGFCFQDRSRRTLEQRRRTIRVPAIFWPRATSSSATRIRAFLRRRRRRIRCARRPIWSAPS